MYWYGIMTNITDWVLSHAEYVALTVNIVMFLAFLYRHELPKAIYWLGTILVVVGVIWMNYPKE